MAHGAVHSPVLVSRLFLVSHLFSSPSTPSRLSRSGGCFALSSFLDFADVHVLAGMPLSTCLPSSASHSLFQAQFQLHLPSYSSFLSAPISPLCIYWPQHWRVGLLCLLGRGDLPCPRPSARIWWSISCPVLATNETHTERGGCLLGAKTR